MTRSKNTNAVAFFTDVRRIFLDQPVSYVDVGAYRGETLRQALAHGPTISKAYLFEPNPESYDSLASALDSLSVEVQLSHSAVSDSESDLILTPRGSMSQVRPLDDDRPSPNEVHVSATTLDTWMAQEGIRSINILKVDVEGHEPSVFSGAAEALSNDRVDVIYVETGFDPENKQQAFLPELDCLLQGYGYRVFKVYEQMHEWLSDELLLRRANLAYFSSDFSARHPYTVTNRAADEYQLRLELADKLELKTREADAHKSMRRHHFYYSQSLVEREQRLEVELTRHRDALRETAKVLSDRERSIRGEHLRLSRYADELELLVESLRGSRSWRITRPIRVLKRMLQRLLRRRVSVEGRAPERPGALAQIQAPDLEALAPEVHRPGLAAVELRRAFSTQELPEWLPQRKVTVRNAAKWRNSGYVHLGKSAMVAIATDGVHRKLRDRVEALRQLSIHFAQRGDYSKALEAIDRVGQLSPEAQSDPGLRMLQAQYLAEVGNLVEARASLETLEAGQLRIGGYVMLGGLLVGANPSAPAIAHGEALEYFNKALSLAGLMPIGPRELDQPFSLDNIWVDVPRHRRIECAPTISVIVPVYNSESTLETALDSILNQTLAKLDVVVVDDGSSDASREVAKAVQERDARVRLMRTRANGGAYVARNTGLRAAHGEHVTVHDADDWSHPEKLELQLEVLQSGHPYSISSLVRLSTDMRLRYTIEPRTDPIQVNYSSVLLPRAVAQDLQGWDERVRTSADSEFLWRLARLHGRPSSVGRFPNARADAPLSFARVTDSSLTQSSATHVATARNGPRREYHEAAQWWYGELPPSKKRIPASSLEFPVPNTLRHGRGVPYEADVLIVGDFNMLGGSLHSTLAMIEGARLGDIRVAAHHIRRADHDVGEPIAGGPRGQLNSWGVPIVAPYETVSVSGVVVAYPEVLKSRREGYPLLDCEWAAVVVNQVAESQTGGEGVAYRPGDVASNLKRLGGHDGHWIPISQTVRSVMDGDSRYPRPAPATWWPLLNLNEWSPRGDTSPPPGTARLPVVGRHGRDHRLKWLEDPDMLRAAFLADSDVEVRILGGASVPEASLGRLPANWTVIRFGAVQPRAFLSELDFFVHFPHSKYIEEFGRSVAEAMAVGVPVVLPPRFEETFGDSALYAEPEQVREVILSIWASRQAYVERVDAGRSFVEEHCDMGQFPERLADVARGFS